MSTKLEFTYRRPTFLSEWFKLNLPDSNTGFRVYDIDWIIFNKTTKKFMLLEEKVNGKTVNATQGEVFNFLHQVIIEGIKSKPDWEYLGYHLISFENKTLYDGKCFFGNGHSMEEITEQELILKLSI
jgi:hypothetical protein